MDSPPLSFFFPKSRRRAGVSPVVATTIILAITVTIGLALWSFANSAFGTATREYGQVITEYSRFTSDRFVIANIDFNNPAADEMAFWVYNSGKFETTINSVVITCKDCSSFDPDPINLTQVSPDDITKPLTMASKTLKKFTFETQSTIESDKTYELVIVSDTGATQSYTKRSN